MAKGDRANARAVKAATYYAQGMTKEAAAREAGYTVSTARARAPEIIDKGIEKIRESEVDTEPEVLQSLGINREYLRKHYKKLAFEQDRDMRLSAELSAPLWRDHIGIDYKGQSDQQKQAVLNLTVQEMTLNQATKPPQEEIE